MCHCVGVGLSWKKKNSVAQEKRRQSQRKKENKWRKQKDYSTAPKEKLKEKQPIPSHLWRTSDKPGDIPGVSKHGLKLLVTKACVSCLHDRRWKDRKHQRPQHHWSLSQIKKARVHLWAASLYVYIRVLRKTFTHQAPTSPLLSVV